MKFKHDNLEAEFEQTHPALRAVVRELDRHLIENGLHECVLTEVSRTDATMAKYYGKNWKKLGKFSWHQVGRAVDIRNRVWDALARKQIVLWLKSNWPDYEIIEHDIGHGDHLHIGVPNWKSRFRRLRRRFTRLITRKST